MKIRGWLNAVALLGLLASSIAGWCSALGGIGGVRVRGRHLILRMHVLGLRF